MEFLGSFCTLHQGDSGILHTKEFLVYVHSNGSLVCNNRTCCWKWLPLRQTFKTGSEALLLHVWV